MSYVVRAAMTAIGLATVAALLAGCAGRSGSPSANAAATPSAGFQAYVDCLRQHGVNITAPSARPSGARPSGVRPSGVRPSGGGGGGAGGFPGFGTAAPSGVDQATWDAAQQACASMRPSFGPRGGNNGAMIAYRNCLRDHGVTASTGPGQLNSADPKVAAAMQACAPLLPTARPSPTPTG